MTGVAQRFKVDIPKNRRPHQLQSHNDDQRTHKKNKSARTEAKRVVRVTN